MGLEGICDGDEELFLSKAVEPNKQPVRRRVVCRDLYYLLEGLGPARAGLSSSVTVVNALGSQAGYAASAVRLRSMYKREEEAA